MTRKYVLLSAALCIAFIVARVLFLQVSPAAMQVTLVLHPFVGQAPLTLNEFHYANPGGAGNFKVRSFQFFLSNIRLVADSEIYAQQESYHLARFDREDGVYRIVLANVPRGDYDYIEFGLGVDATANGTLRMQSDLDPNGRMAWSWDVGYKFVLVEGGLLVDGTQYPLVYHVGFDENYKVLSFPLPARLLLGREALLDFRVDLLRMFTATRKVDMSSLSNVKFERDDASLLANNYAHMLQLESMQ